MKLFADTTLYNYNMHAYSSSEYTSYIPQQKQFTFLLSKTLFIGKKAGVKLSILPYQLWAIWKMDFDHKS